MASFSSIGVGLGGSVDVNALIKSSVDIAKLPITRANGLNYQAELTTAKISTFGQLKSLASTLQTAVGKLTSVTGWNAVSATSSDSKVVSATAIGGTVETSFTVDVTSLAKAQVSTSDAIASGAVGAGTLKLETGVWSGGAFTAGGTSSIDVTVEATDTLSDIAGKINSSGGGMTATLLTDVTGQRLMLRSKTTGEDAGFKVSVTSDIDGNTADASGLSRLASLANDPGTAAATDAVAKINGTFDVTSSTNSFENAVAGVTFKAESVTTSAITISVTKDTSAVKTNIENFVVAYNALNQALSDITKYDSDKKQAALLQGDSATVTMQNSIRNSILSLSNSTGAYQSLSQIGLGMIEGGDLAIDSTKLTAALSNPDDVKALFIGADGSSTNVDGIAEKVKALTSSLTNSTGFFATKDAQLKKAQENNTKEIARVNARADSLETLLKARYTALDTQMSKLNALNAYIGQQVTTWNKSTS